MHSISDSLSKLPPAERRALREAALLGAPAPFCDAQGGFGPPILPLTPWHHLMLSLYRNPLFSGGTPGVADVLQYLWFCSPVFWKLVHKPNGTLRETWSPAWRHFRFLAFIWRWRLAVSVPASSFLLSPLSAVSSRKRRPSQRILDAIRAHQAEALADRPSSPRRLRDCPATPSPTELSDVHELASAELYCHRALGYSAGDFWHTPYAHTHQLLSVHAATASRDPRIPEFNRATDRRVGDYLRARKASRAAARGIPPSAPA